MKIKEIKQQVIALNATKQLQIKGGSDANMTSDFIIEVDIDAF